MDNFQKKIRELFVKLRDLTVLGTSNIVAQAILAIFWFFIASILGESGYGQISYFIAIASIASTIAFIGAGNTVLVYTAKNLNLQGPIFSVTLISGLITSLILYLILGNFEISLFVIGYVIFGLAINEILGRKLYQKYSRYLISQRIIQVGSSLVFYYLIGLEGIILGFAISFFVYLYRLIPILKSAKMDYSLLKPKIGFMSNSYILDLARTFSYYTDKLIVFPIFGFAILGNYQLGIQYLTLLTILPNVVFQYVLPHDASGHPKRKLKLAVVVVSIILAIISIGIVPFLIQVFFPDFEIAVTLVQVMSLAIVPRTISMMYLSRFLGTERSRIVVIGSLVFLVSQILGILILGEIFGIIGVAWSLVIAASLEAVFLFIASRLKRNNPS